MTLLNKKIINRTNKSFLLVSTQKQKKSLTYNRMTKQTSLYKILKDKEFKETIYLDSEWN